MTFKITGWTAENDTVELELEPSENKLNPDDVVTIDNHISGVVQSFKTSTDRLKLHDRVVVLVGRNAGSYPIKIGSVLKLVTGSFVMTLDKLVSLHVSLCNKAGEIMIAKNHDYTAGSRDPFANFRASEVIGVKPELALLVRMLDKLKRMQTFAEQGQLKVKDESVRDAVIDIINYAVLFYGLTKERPHDEDVLKLRDGESAGC